MASQMSDESILKLRRRVITECQKLDDPPHESDIARVEKDDTYLRNFLLHTLGDEDDAFQILMDCLAWRKTFGVHSLTVNSIDEEVIRSGVCYIRGRDVDTNPCVIVNIRLHKKEQDRLPKVKKFLVYLLEDLRNREPDGQVSVVFDMTDAGLSNMDMELVRFVIDCFKFYFPNMLNVLLVYELPFLLQTVWRIVKGWLSERAQAKIKFVKRSDINKFIPREELQAQLGGKDKWQFDADEFYRVHSPPDLGQFESLAGDDGEDGDGVESSDGTSASLRRVHFAEEVPSVDADASPSVDRRSTSGASSRQDAPDSAPSSSVAPAASQTQQQRQAHVHSMLQHQTSKDSTSGSLRRRNISTAGLMEMSPSDVMEFRTQGTEEASIPLSLQNISTNTVGFKVKTTGPDRYHVKPSAGIIPTGASAVVHVTLRSGFDKSLVSHDKFLVEFCPVPPTLQASELVKFWKSLDRSAMQEKILRTRIAKPAPAQTSMLGGGAQGDGWSSGSASSASSALLQKSVNELTARVDNLEENQQRSLRKVERVMDLAYTFLVAVLVLLMAAVAHLTNVYRFDTWL